MPSPLQLLGRRGEEAAKIYLERKGFETVAQNYHAQGGEVDLIMYEPLEKYYVLVEVKTRTNYAYGRAEDSITKNKIRNMMRAGARYFFVEKRMTEMPVVEIHAITVFKTGEKYKIDHFENVG